MAEISMEVVGVVGMATADAAGELAERGFPPS